MALRGFLEASESTLDSCSLGSHGASFEDNSKYALRGTLEAPDAIKIIQQADYTLKSNMDSYLQENATKINQQVQEPGDDISKSVIEASKSPLEPFSNTQQYDIASNQKKAQNRLNFITSEDNFVDDVWRSPGKISEQEKIEIIQTGFQLQAEGKISLKKYYESTDPNSLFQSKGYSIKYESIRRTKLYQQLKDK